MHVSTKYKILILAAFFIFVPVFRAAGAKIVKSLDVSRFLEITAITVNGIHTPKVVIFETPAVVNSPSLLFNEQGSIIQHRVEHVTSLARKVIATILKTSSVFEGSAAFLIDNNEHTTFSFDPDQSGLASVTVGFPKPTEIAGIETNLDANVVRPNFITIRAKMNGADEFSTILNSVRYAPIMRFPKISAVAVEIFYDTPHLLRIVDISFIGAGEGEIFSRVIFFAEESAHYTLYSDAHFGQKSYPISAYQPLATDIQTPVFSLPEAGRNSKFNPDWDKDGIEDQNDLCPQLHDPSNQDADKNKRGDACEDPDQDSILSAKDNCQFVYNPGQENMDLDALGDACDTRDDRKTESKTMLLWLAFGIAAVMLGALVFRAIKNR